MTGEAGIWHDLSHYVANDHIALSGNESKSDFKLVRSGVVRLADLLSLGINRLKEIGGRWVERNINCSRLWLRLRMDCIQFSRPEKAALPFFNHSFI